MNPTRILPSEEIINFTALPHDGESARNVANIIGRNKTTISKWAVHYNGSMINGGFNAPAALVVFTKETMSRLSEELVYNSLAEDMGITSSPDGYPILALVSSVFQILSGFVILRILSHFR